MKKLILTVGLPASGKTTWAQQFCKDNERAVNICKDDLRTLYPEYKESQIIKERNKLTDIYISKGIEFIIWSDTNLNLIHRSKAEEFCKTNSYELEIKEFNTPLEECIKRDIKRGEKAVGDQVIKKMYYQYIGKPKAVEYDSSIPDCYIFDIDGTLANMTDRKPYEWMKVGNDKVNLPVSIILSHLSNDGTKVFIFSGRDSVCREITLDWLSINICHNNEVEDQRDSIDSILFMREEGNNEKDTIIKEAMYRRNIEGKYNVLGIFDDRPSVCRMWRSLGLPVFQIGNPDVDF